MLAGWFYSTPVEGAVTRHRLDLPRVYGVLSAGQACPDMSKSKKIEIYMAVSASNGSRTAPPLPGGGGGVAVNESLCPGVAVYVAARSEDVAAKVPIPGG